MEQQAGKLHEIIKDYRNDDGIYISIDDIVLWAKQFNDDGEFILTELNHIIPKVYLSKEKAKKCIESHINNLIKDLSYTSAIAFVTDTKFLDIQPEHKSQKAILNLLTEILKEKFNIDLSDFNSFPKKNYVYFDDVLATGGTISKQLMDWLKISDNGLTNAEHILKSSKRLSVNLFCQHSWGRSFQSFRLKKEFGDDIDYKIKWYFNYEIQNHVKWNKQNLNNAIPIKNQPPNVTTYLANLSASKYEDYTFRKDSEPLKELLFTNPENRIKYENIILQKGIQIIDMINKPVSENIRPLGLINPHYKTLGLGTHFFTWRNIPNNSPLVFWWQVPGHNWKPLFPVKGRGI